MDFSYFLKVWLRNKWLIIGLTILAIVAAFILLLFKKNLYESVAQYSTGFTAERVRLVDGTSTFDVYGADIKFNNVIETFKSPKVIGALSYTLLLHDLDNNNKPYRVLSAEKKKTKAYTSINIDSVKRILREKINTFDVLNSTDITEIRLIDFLKLYEYDYASITKHLAVNRVEGTDYLNVVFRSENPVLSAVVVNTIGQDFINYYRSLTEQRGEASADLIRSMVNVQQHKVDSLNDLLFKEKVKQGTIDPVSRSTSAMETVKELETQLAEATTNYNVYSQRLAYYKQRKQDLSTGTSHVTGNNDEVIKLQDQRRMLINKNSQDPAIRKQIDDLTNQIAAKSSNATPSTTNTGDELQKLNDNINETEANANAASKTIKDLNSKISLYTGMTNQNPGSGVTVSAIQSQLDIENKALGNIQDKLTQAVALLKENPAENIKQTLVGQPAVEPEPGKRMLTMGLAGVSTFFVASLFILFLALLDPTIKSPAQFSKVIKKPLLTSVVHLNMKEDQVADIILQESGKGDKSEVFRQNLRKLRYELENSGKKVFLITSAKRKEGKTTVLQALAATLLLSGKKVLMIDANFSHNSLSRIFNPEAKLEKLQYSTVGYGEPEQEMASQTPYKNLDIIGSEGGNYTPAEILKQDNVLEHINDLVNAYDYILIEGAAINDHSDTWE